MNLKIFLLGFLALDAISFTLIAKEWSLYSLFVFFAIFILLHRFAFISPFFFFLQGQILVSLFSAQSFYLYFLHLGALLLFFWRYYSFIVQSSFYWYIGIFATLGISLFFAKDLIFSFSLYFDTIDKHYYMSWEVFILLTILHIILFSLLFFKGSDFFKKD